MSSSVCNKLNLIICFLLALSLLPVEGTSGDADFASDQVQPEENGNILFMRYLASVGGTILEKIHRGQTVIRLINYVGLKIKVQCKSEENSLESLLLSNNQEFAFVFKPNIRAATHFWCDASWTKHYPVLEQRHRCFHVFGGQAPKGNNTYEVHETVLKENGKVMHNNWQTNQDISPKCDETTN